MKFQEIPGFEEEKKRLINSYKSNIISHAQLFFGLEGSPNLSLALAFTTYLNCENKLEEDSCGKLLIELPLLKNNLQLSSLLIQWKKQKDFAQE